MPDTIALLVGRRVRVARKAAGLNGQELASRIGMSQSYISEIERGNRNPSLPTLFKIAKTLDKPISFFLQEVEALDVLPEAEPAANEQKNPISVEEELGLELAGLIDDLALRLGLNPTEVARQAGLRPRDLNRIRKGLIPPRSTLKNLALILKINPNSLLLKAGYIPDDCLDERLFKLLQSEPLRTLVWKIAEEFPTQAEEEI